MKRGQSRSLRKFTTTIASIVRPTPVDWPNGHTTDTTGNPDEQSAASTQYGTTSSATGAADAK